MPEHPYPDCAPEGVARSLALGRAVGITPPLLVEIRRMAAERRASERMGSAAAPSDRSSAVPPFSATHAGRTEALARQQIAATLAVGIIASRGVPCGVEEAVKVLGRVAAGPCGGPAVECRATPPAHRGPQAVGSGRGTPFRGDREG